MPMTNEPVPSPLRRAGSHMGSAPALITDATISVHSLSTTLVTSSVASTSAAGPAQRPERHGRRDGARAWRELRGRGGRLGAVSGRAPAARVPGRLPGRGGLRRLRSPSHEGARHTAGRARDASPPADCCLPAAPLLAAFLAWLGAFPRLPGP